MRLCPIDLPVQARDRHARWGILNIVAPTLPRLEKFGIAINKLKTSKMKPINAFGLLSILLPSAIATVLPNAYPHPKPAPLTWELKSTNTTRQFRGLSPVTKDIVWVSGTGGTVLLTINGGTTWSDVSPSLSPENSTTFQFRDIEAFSAKSAVILSIGEGNASRIYHTRDGGATWKPTFINTEPTAFYDCMAFENDRHGLAMSDPVDGKIRLIETWNGGVTWKIVPPQGMPAALTGEFGFAASGTCIEAAAGRWYIASGGVDPGRIFRSADGHQWKVSNSSISGGAAAGVFSVRFRDEKNGIAVGGDYEKPAGNFKNAAWSRDRGVTWHEALSFPGGYRSGVSWVPRQDRIAVAVGTSGSDITYDGGKNWQAIGNGTFDAVECIGRSTCWASGSGGRVARLEL
ncbi:hypothetical protein OPT61_g2902 [Boeremia exigua]|uniref:Uncharacterized protein n=1 Tax=Boeremia exigua TaxID=749465 RepID=A0ACC2IK23_9PLEO|nr:hypothetical protein OPT61_g2902 [Boeremia exigua]